MRWGILLVNIPGNLVEISISCFILLANIHARTWQSSFTANAVEYWILRSGNDYLLNFQHLWKNCSNVNFYKANEMHCLSITFYHGSFAYKYVVGYQFKICSYWKQEAGISIFASHWVQYQRELGLWITGRILWHSMSYSFSFLALINCLIGFVHSPNP